VPAFVECFTVTPARITGYKRRDDAPDTLPEFVTEVDERLEDLYRAEYEAAVVREEPREVPTFTLDRAPGTLAHGWVSQLPYAYLIEPICAASGPCVLPEREVWLQVSSAVKAYAKEGIGGVTITAAYENLGCITLGRATEDGHRISTFSVISTEYARSSYSDARNPMNVVCHAIHADSMAAGEKALSDLLDRVRAAALVPTRKCPRCHGCGEIGFTEPDVKPAPPPEPPSKSRRRR
jgi:hypothetical protein